MKTNGDSAHPSVASVARILRDRYNDFPHHNPNNPLSDLLFIICSRKTNEKNYRASYRALRRAFSTFETLAAASADIIAASIAGGGLARQKAQQIKEIMGRLTSRFGRPTLAPLRRWTDHECEVFLTSLPGVGKKIARCVMMVALKRQVFPVDTHVWRISQRLGWVAPHRLGRTCSRRDMEVLQDRIPPVLRFSLHVNLLSLGREFCRAREPTCQGCPLSNVCPTGDVRKRDQGHAARP
jgi:endonuclease III